MKVLIFSNLFPNPKQALRGNFIASMVLEMSKLVDVTVVSPLPWFPYIKGLDKLSKSRKEFYGVPYYDKWNGIDVYYPKYLFIPVISRVLQPALITMSVSGFMKKLVREKGIDIINAHWIYPDCVSAVWMGKMMGIPAAISARGCDINLYSNYRFRKPQIAWALRNSNKITTVSNALSESIHKKLNIGRGKIEVILNGVDRNIFYFMHKRDEVKKNLGISNDRKCLLFIGQLHEVKGVECMIEALSILKKRGKLDFSSILIGKGPLENDLKSLIGEKKLEEYVFLKGNIPNEQISLWMNACDVLCLPSKREGIPNVCLEALSCGLPVVASDVGGLPEIINDQNGFLVEPRNSTLLADAIENALNKEWNREKISNAMESFSWKRSAELYVNVFKDVLKGK